MPRLIDADLFVAEINERITNAIQWGKNATEEEIKIRAEQAIATFCEASLTAKKMPTVDAEPVIRCKDCENWVENEHCLAWAYEYSDANGYCYLGKRRGLIGTQMSLSERREDAD